MPRLASIKAALLMLVLALVFAAGCAVPRIDPSGQSVFLPGTTPVQSPGLGCGLFFPRPAFVTPPDAPVCNPGAAAPPPVFGPVVAAPPPGLGQPIFVPSPGVVAPTGLGALTVTPGQIVAPVGSEVVLVASLKNGAGAGVAGAPISWTLAQGSAGYIQDVGGVNDSAPSAPGAPAAKKLSNSYAVGATAATGAIIARGTPGSEDDVTIQPGQHYITVASASEGTTNVAVSASGATDWDGRPQTASIYWVDAQWSLPAPTVVEAGQQHTLTTVITRPGTGAPVAGWIVRYEVGEGAGAGLGPQLQRGAEVTTDSAGRASVDVTPVGQGGQTLIRIQIIRPALSPGDPPALLVGQGTTTITSSAPGLKVSMTGPSLAGVGEAVTYTVTVTNPGAVTAKNVAVTDILPPELTLLDSNPPHQVFGAENRWRLGDLPPSQQRTIEISCRTQQRGDLSYCVKARSEGGLERTSCVSTRIFSPTLGLTMTGPETANLGDTVQYRITITNSGTDTLRSVALTDRFGAGLQHTERQTSPISRGLGDLAPGESKRVALSFVAGQEGNHCHTLEVTTAGGQKETRRGCLTVVKPQPAPQPKVIARITGSADLKVGDTGQYLMQVTNDGNVPLTNVRVTYTFTDAQTPQFATQGFVQAPQGGSISWTLPTLAPQQSKVFETRLEAIKANPRAVQRLAVTTDQQVSDSAETITTIVAPAPATPPPPRTPPATPAPATPPVEVTGNLTLRVADLGDPINTNERAIYFIELVNDRNVSDRNVVLSIELPPGLQFEEVKGPSRFAKLEGQTVYLQPIREMRPGEKLTAFRIEATAKAPGKYTVTVKAVSQRSVAPIVQTQETTVLAN